MNDYRAYVECDYNSIYHHGVKGQKWGRRRYQNEDGSYKPGAEGRYYDEVGDSRKGSKGKTEPNKKSSNKSSSNSNEKKSRETADKVKHFVSSHKKEIAIGAAATTALIAGVVLYKSGALKKAASSNKPDISDIPRLTKHPNNPGGGGGAAKVVTDTVKKAANTPEFKVTPNNTKAAVEAAKKAAQSAPRANTQAVMKGAEDLARATKKQQTEAQKIIDAVDSGSDYVNQLLKENEEMLKKIRNGGV